MSFAELAWWLWMWGALLQAAAPAERPAAPLPPAFVETIEVTGPLDLAEYPTARAVTTDEFSAAGATTLAEALPLVPGLALVPTGDRGEAGLSLRGLELRRVPVYLDGIPVYVPYDGTLDLGRFLLAGSHAVLVNRGFSSLTYGPNALGGTVNLLARRPQSSLEGQVTGGVGQGGLMRGAMNVGSRWERWGIQATAARQEVDDALRAGTPLQRRNSFSRDTLLALSLLFQGEDETDAALTFIRQQGAKGQPPYAGDDPAARVRYWRWPHWDKDSLYLRVRLPFRAGWEVRLRAFYDRFANTLDSYDDESYTTQRRRSSFRSEYDDFTTGAGVELRRSRTAGRSTLAFNGKRDVHRDRTLPAPWAHYDDDTFSLAWEEELFLASGGRVVAGLSADRQRTQEAAGLVPGRAEAFNGAVALFQPLGGGLEAHAAASRRTRLPTLKDRYSYRLGLFLPNPDLDPETATSLDSGLRRRWEGGQWELTAFALELEDAIESVPLGGGSSQLQNVGRVRHTGLEGSLEASLNQRLRLGGHVATVHRSRRAGPQLPLTGVPPYRAMAFFHLQAAPWLALRWTGEAEGERTSRTPSGATRELGGFALWHLAAFVTPVPDWEVELRVDNLFDRRHQREEGYPGRGRQLTAALTWRL